MGRKKRLDTAANKLLDVLDRHSQGSPAAEVDAKWSALATVVAKVETRATAPVGRVCDTEVDQAARRASQ
jgi:hypothetical protein